jgi:hypothetical protein
MNNRFLKLLFKLPRSKDFFKVEIDSSPTDENSMKNSIRIYVKIDNIESILPVEDWGFTYNEIIQQESLIKEEAMVELRQKRNEYLKETDKITLICYSKNIPVPSEWTTYQQTLRDLPENSNPDFDSNGNLIGVSFPNKPSIEP